MAIHFWLRAEVKPLEKRTPITPENAKQLIAQGHTISVEKSADRCVSDKEYEDVGCKMVGTGTWESAPEGTIILGLKELPDSKSPLKHTHVYFGHCYKQQGGWDELLKRFISGNGTLLDLEFLVDDQGRRVAAFGRSAGFIGAALGVKNWCTQQLTGEPLGAVDYYSDSDALVADVRGDLKKAFEKTQKAPKVMVMGALGRCGKGSVDFLEQAGVKDIVRWDLPETQGKQGPFREIIEADVFINCIYLSGPIAPFINAQILQEKRNLSVVVDVSCDTSNPFNPVPIYKENTSFTHPCIRVMPKTQTNPPVDVISIDHLPSLVPLESSKEFSVLITPHLAILGNSPVWTRAVSLFTEKCALAQQNAAPTRAQ